MTLAHPSPNVGALENGSRTPAANGKTVTAEDAPMSISHVSDDSFDSDVLGAGSPVLVDFWAEWCMPCLQIAPALEDLAREMDGRIDVAKLNIDENPTTPVKYGVRGIPTLIVFKDGKVAASKVGTLTKVKLFEWIDLVLEEDADAP